MLLKSLVLGLIFSLGIFALKVGLGVYYFTNGVSGKREKVCLVLSLAVGYLFLFLLGYFLMERLSVSAYLNIFQRGFDYGMLLHMIMAVLLVLWGILILRTQYPEQTKSRGWLLLVIPCPLHLSVILLSLAFFLTSLPEFAWQAVILLYLGFLCMVFLTVLALRLFSVGNRQKDLLGWGMLFIAAYFLVAIVVMPHFQDAESIYRLGAYRAKEKQIAIETVVTAGVLSLIAFAGGVLFRINQNRRLGK